MAPVPHQLEPRQTLLHQGRQLQQPLQQGPHQSGQGQHHPANDGRLGRSNRRAELPPEQANPKDQGQARHQRRNRRNPELIRRIEGAETKADQPRQKRHRRHHLQLDHSVVVKLR